jgi:hypothetical protein
MHYLDKSQVLRLIRGCKSDRDLMSAIRMLREYNCILSSYHKNKDYKTNKKNLLKEIKRMC